MLDQFTYAEYADMLAQIRRGRQNLCFGDFAAASEIDAAAGFFILRHDVDLSVDAALEMARREAELGVRATYFLLLGCEHYNLLTEEHADAARELAALGHEVGLHYDVRSMAKRADGDLRPQLQLEVDLLSALSGEPVRSIAMHLPGLLGDDPFAADRALINAYDARFTDDIAYFSDSCGAWRDKAFEAFQNNALPPRVQLLIHPFYWRAAPGDRWDRLSHWGAEQRSRIEAGEAEVGEVWRGHAGVREHDARRDGRS